MTRPVPGDREGSRPVGGRTSHQQDAAPRAWARGAARPSRARPAYPGTVTPRLVLASRSPARTKLLADAGIGHDRLVSDVDEDAVVRERGVTGA